MTLHSIVEATGRAVSRIARRFADGTEEFTCGQCARQESCGLPPNKDCLYKLMMEQDGGLHARPPRNYDYFMTRRPL